MTFDLLMTCYTLRIFDLFDLLHYFGLYKTFDGWFLINDLDNVMYVMW